MTRKTATAYTGWRLGAIAVALLASIAGCDIASDPAAQTPIEAEDGTVSDVAQFAQVSARRHSDSPRRAMQVSGLTVASGSTGQPSNADTDRKVTRHANISLEVDSVDVAMEQLISVTDELGGYVSSRNRTIRSRGRITGTLMLRIPATSMDTAMTSIRDLGELRNERVWIEDITDNYHNTSIHLSNAKVEHAKLQELLERAESVSNVLSVRRELNRVATEIERSTGRMRRLDNDLEYSQINVTLNGKPPISEDPDTIFGKIVTALGDMIDMFWSTVAGIIRFVGFAVPMVIVLGVVYIVLRSMIRRRIRNKK
jgi:hypothetical protein